MYNLDNPAKMLSPIAYPYYDNNNSTHSINHHRTHSHPMLKLPTSQPVAKVSTIEIRLDLLCSSTNR